MTNLDARTESLRLLAGISNGQGLDLGAHRAVHGSLSIPARKRSDEWRSVMLDRIATAQLTGRGGGGFPTAIKLTTARSSRRRPVMVINMMEGEPAAQKDSVLGCFAPHLVLDGAETLAAIVDAVSVTIAIARDNPAAIASMEAAVAERARAGENRLDVSIVTPPARYVGGEESALVSWLDGNDARPTFRSSKPAEIKIKSRPAVVDNAETAAQIAILARMERPIPAPLTTLTSISGAVLDPGVYEVPLESPLRAVISRAGLERTPAAILLGGFGGTFVGPEALDAPYSPDGLRPFGGSVGAGVIVVFGEDACGVQALAQLTRWMSHESAGQCGPCVFGLPSIADDLEELVRNRGSAATLERIGARCDLVVGRGACAHPDGVARMVTSGLRAFAADAHRHASRQPCRGTATHLELPRQDQPLEWR